MAKHSQQIITGEDLARIVAQHVADQLPPGTKINPDIKFFGSHPPRSKETQPTPAVMKYLPSQQQRDKEVDPLDLILQDVGVIITLSSEG